MSVLFNTVICLILIFFQTTIKSMIPVLNAFYDLLIPFICYISINQHMAINVMIAVLLGYTMDSLSSGPFGIFLTTYIWYLLAIHFLSKWFNLKNIYLISVIITIGVLFENLLCVGCLLLNNRIVSNAADMISFQVFLAITTGAYVYKGITYLSKTLLEWVNEFIERKKHSILTG